MPDIDPIPLVIVVAAAAVLWLGVAATVLAVCRTAAQGDRNMSELDDLVANAGLMDRLISQAPAPEHVSHRTQQDLDVAPERPVGHVQVVDRSHFA